MKYYIPAGFGILVETFHLYGGAVILNCSWIFLKNLIIVLGGFDI